MLFKRIGGSRAQIRRFDWNIESPLFGKWFVDIRNSIGMSDNAGTPEYFTEKQDAVDYLEQLGFELV